MDEADKEPERKDKTMKPNLLFDKERRYWLWLAMWLCLIDGTFLIAEHFLRFGGSDMSPGHEHIGLGLVALAVILGLFCRKEKTK